LNTDRTLKVDQNLREIREISEKLLVMSLESDEDKKYLQGLKDLSKSMEGKIPKEFLCPITGELFYEPVVASDLITYEKVAIQTWILKHDSSPVTGNKFDSKDFIPNVVIKKLVKEFYISNQ